MFKTTSACCRYLDERYYVRLIAWALSHRISCMSVCRLSVTLLNPNLEVELIGSIFESL